MVAMSPNAPIPTDVPQSLLMLDSEIIFLTAKIKIPLFVSPCCVSQNASRLDTWNARPAFHVSSAGSPELKLTHQEKHIQTECNG